MGLALAALAGVISPAPAVSAPPAKGWVGQASGSPAFVGLVVRGQTVTAYVCDGRRVGRWYSGLLAANGRATLRDDGGRRLVVRISGATATGIVDLPGRRGARFVAVAARGRAGIFRRERTRPDPLGRPAERVLEGWIRLNDGRVRGLARNEVLRVRRPAPRFAVFLRASSATTTFRSPVSGPPLDARLAAVLQNGPCVSVPRPPVEGRRPKPFTSGPTCGLPAAGMTIGVPRTSARVTARPANLGLSSASVDRLLADLPRLRDLEEARVLQATGLPSLPPSLPSPEAQRRLEALAKVFVNDRKLTAAATALRLARTLEERSARTAAYRLLAGRYLDPELGLIDRPEIAVAETSPTGTVSFTSEQTLTGPFLLIEDTNLEGPDAEVAESEHFGVLGSVLDIGGRVRAGFFSRAEFDTYAVLDIDVPAGAREVEIEVGVSRSVDFDTRLSCLAGGGWAWSSMLITVHGINPDGTFHILDDPAIDSTYSSEFDDAGIPLPLGICPTAPPVPDAPFFDTLPPKLHILDPPAAGGHFLLTIGAHASAYTVGDGQAAADHLVRIFPVIVRSRF